MFFGKKDTFDYKSEIIPALVTEFGALDESVLHSPIPFEMGFNSGCRSDVYVFKQHLTGSVYVTGDLWGSEQKKSDAGNYELMVAHQSDDTWGPNLISMLAYYTQEASLNAGETMGLPPELCSGNGLAGILFNKHTQIAYKGKTLGIMAVIGITKSEIEYSMRFGGSTLLSALKDKGIYPFTIFNRRPAIW